MRSGVGILAVIIRCRYCLKMRVNLVCFRNSEATDFTLSVFQLR